MLLNSRAPDAQPSRHGSGRMVLISGVVSGRKTHTPGLISGVTGSIRKLAGQRGGVWQGSSGRGIGAAPCLLCPDSRQALKQTTYLTMFPRCRQHLGCQCCRSPDGQGGGPRCRCEAFDRQPGPPHREGRRGQCPARPQGRRGEWHPQGLGGQAEGQGPWCLQEVGWPWLVCFIFGGGILSIA